MKGFIEKRYILRRNMLAIIGICLSFYFSYHLVAGHRGYFRLMTLEHKIAEMNEKHSVLKTEREAIEKRVVMMRPGSIDRDLLDERARYVLGYHRADEYILLQNGS
jgi:cell division protein FtsB